MSIAKRGRRVIAYVRTMMEEEVEVVKEEDNHIILLERNNKKIGGMYANERRHGEK